MCWPWRRHEAAMPPVLRFLYFNYENNYKTVCELSTAFCYFLHHNPLLKMPFWSSALQYSSRFCRSQASNIFRLVCVEFCFFSARLSLFLVFGWLHSLVQSQYRSCPRQVCLVSSSQSNFFGLCCWMRRCSHVTPSSEQLLRRLAEAGRLGICRYTGYGCGAGRSAAQERGPGTPNTPQVGTDSVLTSIIIIIAITHFYTSKIIAFTQALKSEEVSTISKTKG